MNNDELPNKSEELFDYYSHFDAQYANGEGVQFLTDVKSRVSEVAGKSGFQPEMLLQLVVDIDQNSRAIRELLSARQEARKDEEASEVVSAKLKVTQTTNNIIAKLISIPTHARPRFGNALGELRESMNNLNANSNGNRVAGFGDGIEQKFKSMWAVVLAADVAISSSKSRIVGIPTPIEDIEGIDILTKELDIQVKSGKKWTIYTDPDALKAARKDKSAEVNVDAHDIWLFRNLHTNSAGQNRKAVLIVVPTKDMNWASGEISNQEDNEKEIVKKEIEKLLK